jgi:hypothetical protein
VKTTGNSIVDIIRSNDNAVNYDTPQCFKSYIFQIGRNGIDGDVVGNVMDINNNATTELDSQLLINNYNSVDLTYNFNFQGLGGSILENTSFI